MHKYMVWLCGQPVVDVRTDLRTTNLLVPCLGFCTQIVRRLWVTRTVSAQLLRTVSAHIFCVFQSVRYVVMPTNHRPYYYVYL